MTTTTAPFPGTFPGAGPAADKQRRVCLIVSKGGLDEVYPALILANAARMSGIEAVMFFTFYGLDAVTESKVDHLHVNMVGNPTSPMPTMVAGLPGTENLAAKMMKSKMEKLSLPGVREMLQMLDESGAEIYGCELAAQMMDLKKEDLLPCVRDIITAGDAGNRPVTILIYAAGKGGPTTEQRHKLGGLDTHDIDMKVAVVTDSTIVRGILTAVGWVFSQTPPAFAPRRLQEAAETLGLTDDERRTADVLLAEICDEGNLPPLPSLRDGASRKAG